MKTAIVTGSGGLVGSAVVRHLSKEGWSIVGLDNDMRARYFGPASSTTRVTSALQAECSGFEPFEVDVRDSEGIDRVFARHASGLELVVHAAAQPSHDWAASDPTTDFGVNAVGTLNLLEASRRHSPDATFIFVSTNKVYGDRPNDLPLEECTSRYDLPADHRYFEGVDTSMSIDRSMHSLFGVSKTAADLLVQEYGRYFDMPTVAFRCGCITGPSHAGAMLHGFLSYLMKCTVTGAKYTVFGYNAKQVRDNIHSADLAAACTAYHDSPRGAAVYNLGGGRPSSCSMIEAIARCERVAGRQLDWKLSDQARKGDHRWWVSDLTEFQNDYPAWHLAYDLDSILRQIHDQNVDRWIAEGR